MPRNRRAKKSIASSSIADPFKAWGTLMLDTWALGWEASAVIGMRTAKLARGGQGALYEASLMTSEKVTAAIELQSALMTRGIDQTPLSGAAHAVRFYRSVVRANRRRLRRSNAS